MRTRPSRPLLWFKVPCSKFKVNRWSSMASATSNLEPRTFNFSVRDACLILVVLVACVFANGVTTPYMFDDVYWIRDNPTIRTLWPPSSARRPLGYYLSLIHI